MECSLDWGHSFFRHKNFFEKYAILQVTQFE